METFKDKVEAHLDAKVTIGFGDDVHDTYEEINTADGYEVYVHMPAGSWKNVFPESDLYYYVDDLVESIKEHIIAGGTFYVSETIAEMARMEDKDGEFWEDMCYEFDLISEDEDE